MNPQLIPLGKVKVPGGSPLLCQDFQPTAESPARSALLSQVPVPSPGPRGGWDLAAGKHRPFLSPTRSPPPRPTTRGGRDQGGLRKLINQVPAQPPGGGEGRGEAAAAVAGVTGGRRCREGRDFTLPAGSCATRARSCVASNRHPLAPA